MNKKLRTDLCSCQEHQLRSITLKLTFILVIAMGLLGCGLIVRFQVFSETVMEGVEGDSILHDLSTSYCKDITVKSGQNGTRFTAYVSPGVPHISSKRLVYNSGLTFYIPSWAFQFWQLHLIKGTSLDINICTDQYLLFYVIKGKPHYSEWTQSTLFKKYYYKNRILPEKDCKSRAAYAKYTLTAEETDFFYIMFSSSVGWRFFTHVSTMITFNRTVYNTTNASQYCKSNGPAPCIIPLNYSSDDITLIEFEAENGKTPDTFKSAKVILQPGARKYYYIVFFCGIFGSISLLTVLYTIWRYFARRVKLKPDNSLVLLVPKRIYTDSKGSKIRPKNRRTTRATLGSFEVVSRTDTETDREEDDEENMTFHEDPNAGSSYSTNDQVRDSCLTAAGISAI